jgi:signal transduction histidine kinase/CheY-like chemotaxis protein
MTTWLAEFSDSRREAEFASHAEHDQLPSVRAAMGICAALLVVVYVLDVQLFLKVNPAFLWSLAGARSLQLLGIAYAAWVPGRRTLRWATGWAVFLAAVLVSIGHQWASYLIVQATGRPVQGIWAGLFTLVSLTGVILPMRFAVAAALAFVVPTILIDAVAMHMAVRDLMHVCISLCLVMGLGTVVNHRLNRWRRLEFANLEIERQTNALLTQEVEAQTRTAGNLKAQANALEARLVTAQRLEAMGRLAGGVAHDLNNLLTPIMGYTDLAMYKSAGDSEVVELLREVKAATMNAKDMVAHLLAVGCRQRLNPATFAMDDFLREQEPRLRALLRNGINLRIEAVPGIPVVADRTQMIEVLTNLVINARDAVSQTGDIIIRLTACQMSPTRAIELGIEQGGPFAVLSVEDNGTGMDEATRARLFEPFFTTKPLGQGSGLGLATVYGIVRQHQGGIQVESTLGRGTTFTLWLPSTSAVGAVVLPAAVGNADVEGGDETLLVVDDDAVVRELLVRILADVGYRVISADSGPEALDAARIHEGPIHLAICDLVMPGMRGPEVWAQLHAQRPETRVLFVSGYSNEVVAPQDDLRVLAKPFARAAILGRVRSILDETN